MKAVTTVILLIFFSPFSNTAYASLSRISTDTAITTVYAAHPDRPAIEMNSLNHGIFSWAVIQALSSDTSTKKDPTLASILDNIARNVSDKSGNLQKAQIISDGKQLDTPICATNRTYLLSIGINTYQEASIPRLQHAVSDIKAIASSLEKKCNNLKQTLLVDNEATTANILKQLKNILQKTDSKDRVIINFSGLGINISGNNYLIPYDANYSSDIKAIQNSSLNTTDLIRPLQKSKTGSGIILLDVCFPQLTKPSLR